MQGSSINVLLSQGVADLFTTFSECFDVRIAFFSVSGEEQLVGEGKPCCRYCRLVREDLFKLDVCLALDRAKRQEALYNGGMISYTCHAGMTEAVVPLFYEDLHIGFVMIGQYRLTDRVPPDILAEWKRAGKAAGELSNAFLEAPYYTESKAASMRKLFSVLTEHITAGKMLRLQEQALTDRVKNFLMENISRNVTLQEAAETAGKSPSALSHIMKRVCGAGVKSLHLQMKCSYAEKLLSSVPGCTVKEAAAAVGYGDPYYFSRLFKKYTGGPPNLCKGSL